MMRIFANTFKVSAVFVGLLTVPAIAAEAIPTASSNYTQEVLSKILDNAVYPRTAADHAKEGVVTLALTVDATGDVADVKVLSSSGVSSIDKAALKAAIEAAPYPAPAKSQEVVVGKVRFALN